MKTEINDSTIRVIEGSIIPNFHVKNTDVMMLESEITEELRMEMWEQDIISQAAFLKSPQMPICVFDGMSSGIKSSLAAMSSNEQQNNILRLMRENANAIYDRLGFFVPSIIPAEFEEAANDPDFTIALLPKNWFKTTITGSANWSEIIDSLGRTRMRVYISNNKMERKAYFQLVPRFSIRTVRSVKIPQSEGYHPLTGPLLQCQVMDQTEVIYATSGFHESEQIIDEAMHREQLDLQNLEANKWLKENYPEWKSPLSYWD